MKIYRLSDLSGEDWAILADRETRQARMLGAAANEVVKVTAIGDDHAPDLARLARAHGVEFLPDASDAEPIATAWQQRGLTISLIVASHNYGHYVREAIDSTLAQSYRPDEILLSDDDSTDGSIEILEQLMVSHPDTFLLNINQENLGIEKHFNVAANLTSGDLIVFLGADNRLPSDYVEACLESLLCNPKAAICYTDFALFGNRAKQVYQSMDARFIGPRIDTSVFLTDFPAFSSEARAILFDGSNFIHGSSTYRRTAFDAVGGYGTRHDGPEDLDLFLRMLEIGWSAVKASHVYLEYRQHSVDQANMQFSYFWELGKLREDIATLRNHLDLVTTERDQLKALVDRIQRNPFYRFAFILSGPVRALLRKRRTAAPRSND